jgi:hypothetical protein
MEQYNGIIVNSFDVVEVGIDGAWETDFVVLRFQRIHHGSTMNVTLADQRILAQCVAENPSPNE